jgi:hypothetical protein
MRKLLLAAIVTMGIIFDSDLNKEVLFQQCIDYRGAGDAACEECWREVYGDDDFEESHEETNELTTKKTIEI